MIKIEITDPQRENPDVLVKLAAFLMECAGHTMVKAPSEMKETYTPTNYCPPTFSDLARSVDEAVDKLSHELPTTAPYQHCAESDLTNHLKGIDPHMEGLCNPAQDFLDKFVKPVAEQLRKEIEVCDSNGAVECKEQEIPEHSHEPIVAEKPKSESKRKRTPSKPKFDVISETGVTEVTEDLMPPPPIAPPPPVNGNTLVDKIVMAKATNKLTHEEVTAIVRKHGLVAIKDIFTNDHLIPLIDADLDEALRGK